jgi:replication factor C small subunit
MSNIEDPTNFLWQEKYRPKTINDCILPKGMKDTFNSLVKSGELTNCLFESTKPGTGKTTVALALCNDIDADVLFINASEDSGIDTLRSEIRSFASTVSLTGSKKVVVLDEFDNSSQNFQKAFRGFIEEFSDNCRFILTCNFANNIIEPIRSRMKIYSFVIPEDEKTSILKQMTLRCLEILKKEKIKVENPKIVGELVKLRYPDNRQLMIELQHYSQTNGEIDEGILGVLKNSDSISEFLIAIKEKKFLVINQMVPKFSTDYANFIRSLYDKAITVIDTSSIPVLIEIIGENNQYANSVVDLEIHIRYLAVQLISEIKWK